MQANIRKLNYAREAYENHDCTGDGCERCKNAEASANEAIAAIPQWIVKVGTVMATIVYPLSYVIWLVRKLWCKLFHRHDKYIT